MKNQATKDYGIGNGYLPLPLQGKKHYIVFGGPYRDCPDTVDVGVKMAKEIYLPCEVNIPTEDFRTPPLALLDEGLLAVVQSIARGETVYVGCMAGRGRTGLFLAVLAKAFGVEHPVEYVRENYYSHAVETKEQYSFVINYSVPQEVLRILKWARFKSHFRLKNLLTNIQNLG